MYLFLFFTVFLFRLSHTFLNFHVTRNIEAKIGGLKVIFLDSHTPFDLLTGFCDVPKIVAGWSACKLFGEGIN